MDESAIRKKARDRAMLLPGVGYASLGHPARAFMGYAFALEAVASFLVLELWPGPLTRRIAVGSLAVLAVVGLVEVIAVGRIEVRTKGEPATGRLHFAMVFVVFFILGLLVGVGFFLNFGAMLMAGNGMSPTVLSGERFLYHKQVDPTILVAGGLVTFGVSDRSNWGQPGVVVFARILAVPGDKLSRRNGRYVVNGRPGPMVGPLERGPAAVMVPEVPGVLEVPPHSYFVVQDQPSQALDSQSLSWVKTDEIISTKHWLVSTRGLLQPLQ